MKGPTRRKLLTTRNLHLLASALQQRRIRDQTGLVFIEGIRALIAAHTSGHKIKRLLFSKRLYREASGHEHIQKILDQYEQVEYISADEFRALSSAKHVSGIAALIQQQWMSLQALDDSSGIWLLVRHMQSMGNIGTLLRSAHSLKCRGIICVGKTLDLYDRDVMNASLGAAFHIAKIRTIHRDLMQWKHVHPQWQIIGTSAHASVDLQDYQFPGKGILCIGHERIGLNEEEKGYCDEMLRIPMFGRNTSLNAAVAGSIMIYEACRQLYLSVPK